MVVVLLLVRAFLGPRCGGPAPVVRGPGVVPKRPHGAEPDDPSKEDTPAERRARAELEHRDPPVTAHAICLHTNEIARAIEDNVASCLLMMDDHARPVYMNQAAMEVTSFTLKEL